jgi:thiosulfate dehydrogenase (quinone) large subunit
MKTQKTVFTLLRYVMSFIFLWAFFDKVFGLGFSTTPAQAWIHGGSPTAGFLGHAVKGPFMDLFHSLSGVVIVDWLFMLGLLFIGLALLCKKYIKWGAIAGSVMLALMYLSLMLPANNPVIDEHIVYILVLILLWTKERD